MDYEPNITNKYESPKNKSLAVLSLELFQNLNAPNEVQDPTYLYKLLDPSDPTHVFAIETCSNKPYAKESFFTYKNMIHSSRHLCIIRCFHQLIKCIC